MLSVVHLWKCWIQPVVCLSAEYQLLIIQSQQIFKNDDSAARAVVPWIYGTCRCAVRHHCWCPTPECFGNWAGPTKEPEAGAPPLVATATGQARQGIHTDPEVGAPPRSASATGQARQRRPRPVPHPSLLRQLGRPGKGLTHTDEPSANTLGMRQHVPCCDKDERRQMRQRSEATKMTCSVSKMKCDACYSTCSGRKMRCDARDMKCAVRPAALLLSEYDVRRYADLLLQVLVHDACCLPSM
jgi:hypothetical protein